MISLDSCSDDVPNLMFNLVFSQTVNMAVEVRKPVYGIVSYRCVTFDTVLQQMSSVRWDVKEIMSQHNAYIDTLLKVNHTLHYTILERNV